MERVNDRTNADAIHQDTVALQEVEECQRAFGICGH